jgi:hypothetical protein
MCTRSSDVPGQFKQIPCGYRESVPDVVLVEKAADGYENMKIPVVVQGVISKVL